MDPLCEHFASVGLAATYLGRGSDTVTTKSVLAPVVVPVSDESTVSPLLNSDGVGCRDGDS